MVLEAQTELTRAETDAFLGRHETGVIAFARGDVPYSIPISYGYDAGSRRFFLRLVSTPDSEKRQFLSSAPAATLVVYEDDDPLYWSVVAKGTLAEVAPEDLTVENVEQYGKAKRPLFEMWTESRRDVDISLYELDPEDLSGRRVKIQRDDQ